MIEWEQLQNLRARTQSCQLHHNVALPPEVLWPVISNTDMLNAQVGLSPTENIYTPVPQGGSRLQVQTELAGQPVSYLELPFEWMAPHTFSVERIFDTGPLHYLKFGVELKAQEQGTQIQLQLDYVPVTGSVELENLLQLSLQGIGQAYAHFSQKLSQGARGVQVFYRDLESPQLSQLAASWQNWAARPELAQALSEYVLRAPDRYAARIRPFEVAQLYHLEPLKILELCLYLVQCGDLHLRWDLRCPGCKGPKESSEHLNQVQGEAHCETCVVNYGIGFDQNLELTFFPASQIREVVDDHFCAGGPANTPHLTLQQNLWPHQSKNLELHLPAGPHIFRALSLAGELGFVLQAEGRPEFELDLGQAFADQELVLQAGCQLRVHNPQNYLQTLQAEDLNWQADAVTGALVAALPEFRELFGQELLANDQRLPISSQPLVCAAFVLPEAQDNPEALEEALNWVEQGFRDEQGAVVRSEGNLLMASFPDALNALRAACSLLSENQELADHLGPEYAPSLLVSLYEGPAEILSYNGHLDYQGEAPEMAGLLLSLARGQDLILTENILADRSLKQFLSTQSLQIYPLQFAEPPENFPVIYRICMGGGAD